MKNDDASWHYSGDFPNDLKEDAGSTHIGMFVAWALATCIATLCDDHVDSKIQKMASITERLNLTD